MQEVLEIEKAIFNVHIWPAGPKTKITGTPITILWKVVCFCHSWVFFFASNDCDQPGKPMCTFEENHR